MDAERKDESMGYQVIYDMIRGGQCVANVYVSSSGKCLVSWPTSTIIYDSEEDARAVHIKHMGGRGESTRFVPVWSDGPSFMRGVENCSMDLGENAPFGVFGGLEGRSGMRAPDWENLDPDDFVRGYIAQAENLYGPDWRTCTFGWGPALTIGDDDDAKDGDDGR